MDLGALIVLLASFPSGFPHLPAGGSMKTHNTIATLVLVSLVGLGGPLSLRAQDRSDFTELQTTLKVE